MTLFDLYLLSCAAGGTGALLFFADDRREGRFKEFTWTDLFLALIFFLCPVINIAIFIFAIAYTMYHWVARKVSVLPLVIALLELLNKRVF